MEYMKKFSEAIEIAQMKKNDLEKIMGMVMYECRNIENQYKIITDLYTGLSRRQNEINLENKRLEMRSNELDTKERILDGREKGIGLKENQLHAREDEADGKDKNLMIRFSELGSKENNVEKREKEIDSREKLLDAREHKADGKELFLSRRKREIESEAKKLMKRRMSRLHLKETFLEGRKQKIDLREKKLHAKYLSRQNEIDSEAKKLMTRFNEKRRLDSGISDASQEMNMEGSSSQQRKRNCFCGSDGQIQPHNHQSSDIMGNFAAKYTSHPSSFDISTEKGELWRNVNIGDVWACFDSKYELPRSYAQVIRIFDMDGKDWLEVAWLKPRPVFAGENEWINADLPVTCGQFYCSGVNIASPKILCHPVSCVGESPWTIIPCGGEIWAIYNYWNIITWSCFPKIHRNCEYEIVEIVSDHQVDTTSGVRVAYLDKIMGSQNLFQRRSNNGEDSFLIDCTCLYRFSHRVRSVQKDCIDMNGTLHCVYELDQKCLPEEFC